MKIKIPRLRIHSYILLAVIALSATVSFIVWAVHFPGVRRTFVYESAASGSYSIESRYLVSDPEQGKIRNYIDELLLGPISEHCRPIFADGTRVLSCFRRNSVLYVEISDDFLLDDAEKTDFRKKCGLFKKNIIRNFPGIKQVVVFAGGNELFADDK